MGTCGTLSTQLESRYLSQKLDKDEETCREERTVPQRSLQVQRPVSLKQVHGAAADDLGLLVLEANYDNLLAPIPIVFGLFLSDLSLIIVLVLLVHLWDPS